MRTLWFAFAAWLLSQPLAVLAADPFPHPDRIRYDGHCLTVDGQDLLVYSAAFHYFRVPPELWRERFQKIKDAGFNTVETYVPWNWHERILPAGLDDFSQVDLSELEAWLKMAQDEFGLYTIVRPGPFICAEWAGGAYPRWLAKFAPGQGELWLRGASDSHIAWSRHWYLAVGKVFAREQLTRKPKGGHGILLVQIENEYNYHSTPAKARLLKGLSQALRESGVEVPLFTCLTNECRASRDPELSQVFDGDNYYVGLTEAPSCAHRMVSLRQRQPDAPGFVVELQGGWFSTLGGSLSESHYSDARHFNAVLLMSLLGGATLVNPYMFVGGTHFAGWGARGMTTTYDYNAAIRENGSVGAKYAVAKAVGAFLREQGGGLLRAEGGPCELQGAPKTLFGGLRVAPDGTRFVFLHNTDPKQPLAGTATLVPGKLVQPTAPVYNIDQNGNRVLVKTGEAVAAGMAIVPFQVAYALEPLGAKVLVIPPGKVPEQGIWYPQALPPVARPATLPAPVRIASVQRCDEDFNAVWRPWPNGVSLPELGIADQRYALYRSKFTLSPAEAATLNRLLVNAFSRDIVAAQINGRLPIRRAPAAAAAAAANRNLATSHTRIGPNDFDNVFEVGGLLRAGENDIVLLYENIGHEHGYVPMEELTGVRSAGLSDSEQTLAKPLAWEVATDLGGIANGWTAPGFQPLGWETVSLDTAMAIPQLGNKIQPHGTPTALLSWYRLEFELPAADPKAWIPWRLLLNASGNGYLYLNGHNLGRHYELGPQREFFLPECWLHFGVGQKNVLVLGLRQTANGAVLRAAEVSPYPDAAELRP